MTTNNKFGISPQGLKDAGHKCSATVGDMKKKFGQKYTGVAQLPRVQKPRL